MDELSIEHRLSDVEARAKSNTHRITNLERVTNEIHTLAENMAQLVVELKHTNESISDHEDRLTNIEAQAQDRLTHIWKAVISALAGATVGAVITAIIAII